MKKTDQTSARVLVDGKGARYEGQPGSINAVLKPLTGSKSLIIKHKVSINNEQLKVEYKGTVESFLNNFKKGSTGVLSLVSKTVPRLLGFNTDSQTRPRLSDFLCFPKAKKEDLAKSADSNSKARIELLDESPLPLSGSGSDNRVKLEKELNALGIQITEEDMQHASDQLVQLRLKRKATELSVEEIIEEKQKAEQMSLAVDRFIAKALQNDD